MIDSNKVKETIMIASSIVLTSHKNIDLDAIGSLMGLYYICKSLDKNVYIVIEDKKYEPEVQRSLSTIKKEDKVKFTKFSTIKNKIGNNPLLIITDTNKSTRIQNIKLLNIKDKILIDHHIKSEDSIGELTYEYLNMMKSSATEIVLELINELNVYIPSHIATIMLSGIYVDTNGFIMKTDEDTHECAANLYRFGADAKEAQYLLKQNFKEYKRRQDMIARTQFYNNIAVAVGKSKIYDSTELAKASGVLLTFNGIEASFTIARLSKDIIGISARSLGHIDVEKIMKRFKGGGHKTDAAAQIQSSDLESVKNDLLKCLGVSTYESNIY